MRNLSTVQDIYAAFGRGDIPAILEKLADEVDWEYAYRVAPNPVPWLQPRADRAGVALFFESLSAVTFHVFTPKVFLEGPGLVVALFDLEVTVQETGKRIVETDEVHLWYFDEAGKVIRFRHCADTYQHVASLPHATEASQSARLRAVSP